MAKGFFIVKRIAVIVLAAAVLSCGSRGNKDPQYRIEKVDRGNVTMTVTATGGISAVKTVQVGSQVSGVISHLYADFKSRVKQGQLLAELDPTPFQAQVEQRRADLTRAQIEAANARVNYQRQQRLASSGLAAQADLDNSKAQYESAQAQVQQSAAALRQSEANLRYTKILSPIDGITGVAKAQVGDLLSPSSGILTTVSTVDPIKVYFTASEQAYLNFVRRNPTAAERVAAQKRLELELVLADGILYGHKGTFFFADREVSVQTGTIRVAGLFPNPGNVLRPGQYGRVRAVTSRQEGALLVPQRAVTELQGSYQVAVVDRENTITIRTVKVGERVGTMWVIAEGVHPGERVVVEGVQKVRPGMRVHPQPFVAAPEKTGGN